MVKTTTKTKPPASLEKLETVCECVLRDLARWDLNGCQKFYVLELVSNKLAKDIIKNKKEHPKVTLQRAQQLIK